LVRLDVETGAVVTEVDIAGHCPYGLAFDGNNQVLWGFSACSQSLVKLDVNTLAWSTVALPTGCAYGITVDPDGRVWTSGGGCVARYTPATQSWNTVAVGSSNRGIAHDGQGSIWVADTGYGVHRLADTTMATQANIALSGGGFVGMAVDFYHRVWAISQGGSRAHRIDPSTLASLSFPTGSNPYTYSDMTGFQLQNAAPPMGTFVAVLEGCGAQAEWRRLSWMATTPSGTYVRFRARTASDRAGLAVAPLVPIAKQPSDSSPADLGAALEAAAAGSSRARFLELEIVLYSIDAAITPELSHVRVTTSCPPVLG
jgi:streptogramin lyase